MKKVKIDYLYLDLNTCDRCVGTDKELEEVIDIIAPALETAGYEIEYRKIEMTTAEDAAKYRFLSSPTIRVNGSDICGKIKENACGCCSDISGTDVTCRVFTYEGKDYEVPPKEMLAKEILKSVFSPAAAYKVKVKAKYTLPKNLKDFYSGKISKSACCSGGCSC